MVAIARLSSVVCAFLMLLPTARAQAPSVGNQRVAVARLEFEGKIPKALQDLFAGRLLEGLSVAGFDVLSQTEVERRLAGSQVSPATCKDAACLAWVASALSASFLVGAKVSENSKTYDIAMEIIHGRTGAPIANSHERCETCGVEEAGEKMGLAASALRERLEAVARAPARFILKTRPPSATAEIDGKTAGITPLDVYLAGGAHRVRLLRHGYETAERTITVVSGVDESMDLDLVAIPSTFPYRTSGIATLAAGAALLVAGIVTMSLDQNEIGCSAQEKDPYGHCPWIRSTKWWGTALIGTGAAAATLGGVFLYLAPRAGSPTIGVGVARSF